MAKFKQVPQAYLFNKLMGFWGNMVKNYRSDVQDDDFFGFARMLMRESIGLTSDSLCGWRT